MRQRLILDFSDRKNSTRDKKVSVGKDEKLTYVLVLLDDSASKDVTIELTGEGAEAYLFGLFWGEGKTDYKIETAVVHRAPKTKGETFVRGVLTGAAQADFHGLIKIEKGAGQSEDFLTENTLLLSPKARADSVPSLEIEADDVRAGHAATVGQVDAEQLFYLMSRGLSRKKSEELIVSGFFQPVLQRLPKDAQVKIAAQLKQKDLL